MPTAGCGCADTSRTRSWWPATRPADIWLWLWRSGFSRSHEEPAALVAISPLLQLAKAPKQSHPNIKTDAMFPAKAFDALFTLVAKAARKHVVDGEPEQLYEPLDHVEPGLPRTLIHVSGSEVLLHDARAAARALAAAGVPTEVRVWPGQIHDFQLAAPMVPEAERSLRQIGEYIREATG